MQKDPEPAARPFGPPSATALGLALVLVAGAPASAPAQPTYRLTEPEAVFPEDFGSIQTVRELPDGRVLVADPLGGALYAVDLDAGTRAVVGREGQGPGEYRQPDAVWPLPGDSTLLVDLGNGRLTALGPDLSFGPTMPIAQGEFRPGTPPVLALPQAVDGRGRLYFRSLSTGRGTGGEVPDSSSIVRLPRGGTTETVARFKTPDTQVTRSGSAGDESVSIQQIPLSTEDAWGVAPDGSVVLARSSDYYVEWIDADGHVIRGPSVPWDATRIGTPEKEEWVAENGRSGGGLRIGIEVTNGVPSMSFGRGGGGGGPEEIDTYTWPDRKPPIYGGRIGIDPSGNAWVRRHVDAGGPSTYDVFDRSGARVGTVELEPGNRVLGFGRDAVYVASFDEFDLNYLERHPLPSF